MKNYLIAPFMKKLVPVLLPAVVTTINVFGQNVGINTTTPQATLDVKGNQRFGGGTRFTSYDSASGKIIWKNSNLFLSSPQYVMRHSSSAEGLYYGANQLEYRDSAGTPRFFTNWSNGNGYFYGNLGIGNATPNVPLSFSDALGDKIALWGDSGINYGLGIQSYLLQVHTDVPEADIAFGSGSSSSFSETMRIKGTGNVGIGTKYPGAKLHVYTGASGYAGEYYQGMVIEGSGNTYSNIVTPNGSESGVLFGNSTNVASGGIIYNSEATSNGLQFRTNGNSTRMVIDQFGKVGIGTTTPNAPLSFPAVTGQKITLYPGATGNAGFGVQGNLLQVYSDNSNADIAFGYDQAGSLNERFRFKANGALAVSGNTGISGQVLKSNGSGSAPSWTSVSNWLFNNISQMQQTSNVNVAANVGDVQLTGMGQADYYITVTANAKLVISSSAHVGAASCFACGATNLRLVTSVYRNGVFFGDIKAEGNCNNGSFSSLSTGIVVLDLTPGGYNFSTKVGVYNGPDISVNSGKLFLMVAPQ